MASDAEFIGFLTKEKCFLKIKVLQNSYHQRERQFLKQRKHSTTIEKQAEENVFGIVNKARQIDVHLTNDN